MNGTNSESKLLDVNLRGFFQRGGEFRFGTEVVRSGGRIGVPVTLVIFRRSGEGLLSSFTQSLRLIEKHYGPEGAFRQLEEKARPRFAGWPQKGRPLPLVTVEIDFFGPAKRPF